MKFSAANWTALFPLSNLQFVSDSCNICLLQTKKACSSSCGFSTTHFHCRAWAAATWDRADVSELWKNGVIRKLLLIFSHVCFNLLTSLTCCIVWWESVSSFCALFLPTTVVGTRPDKLPLITAPKKFRNLIDPFLCYSCGHFGELLDMPVTEENLASSGDQSYPGEKAIEAEIIHN